MFSVGRGQRFGRKMRQKHESNMEEKNIILFVILLHTYPHKNIYISKTINAIKIILSDSDSTINFA